jgi:hypothetical protein
MIWHLTKGMAIIVWMVMQVNRNLISVQSRGSASPALYHSNKSMPKNVLTATQVLRHGGTLPPGAYERKSPGSRKGTDSF